ncbi:MAG: hypothetical protein ACXW3C_06135 [Pyrinomonadaceae bacterium]
MNQFLEIEGVTKRFGNRRALDDVSLRGQPASSLAEAARSIYGARNEEFIEREGLGLLSLFSGQRYLRL